MRIVRNLSIMLLLLVITNCGHKPFDEYKLDLADIIDTGYGNTTEGDSMYWAIYEEWDNDCTRHLLYMNKETFDSLESAVEHFNKADLEKRDSLNNAHGFTIIRDSEGLHLCSIR